MNLTNLSPDFWNTHKHLVLVASDGKIGFTPKGRAHFAPRMARCGFAITNVTTLSDFREVLTEVSAVELDANTAKMEQLLHSPSTTAEECALIRRILGMAPAA